MKFSVKLSLLAAGLVMVGILAGCYLDSEYEQNRLTMGIGFEELAKPADQSVFVYTDTTEPVFLRFIALRFVKPETQKATVYYFDERIPGSSCDVPLPAEVEAKLTARYDFDRRAGIDTVIVLK